MMGDDGDAVGDGDDGRDTEPCLGIKRESHREDEKREYV